MPKGIPFIGDYIVSFLMGGSNIGALTISRFLPSCGGASIGNRCLSFRAFPDDPQDRRGSAVIGRIQ